MKAIIIGYPYSGKTTFFDAISESETKETQRFSNNIRNIKVEDDRLKKLNDIYSPKKFSPAEINIIDSYVNISDFGKGNTIFTPALKESIAKSETTVLVSRAFSPGHSAYFKETVEPYNELKNIIEEMCFLDFMAIEKRLERLKKENKKGIEMDIFDKCCNALQENIPIYKLGLSEEDLSHLSGFSFLTQNRIMAVINSEDDFLSEEEFKNISGFCKDYNISVLKINAEIEKEISLLDNEEDKKDFLKEYSIDQIISIKFVKELFNMMGLISFFTVGKDEVKAWPIRNDTKALKAAGKIHSDIERGFIRAEVVNYDEFREHDFDMNKLKADGKLRLEGKEYIVQDGDIINFRFNV